MTSPRFSIIIPAFNEENTIATCIQAIEDNDYPVAQYDITVADNGSVDNTAAIAGSQGVKVLECGRAKGIGVAAMRNQGAAVTRGDILIFIDADVEIPKNFLKTAEQYFDSEFEGVLGFVDRPPQMLAGWDGYGTGFQRSNVPRRCRWTIYRDETCWSTGLYLNRSTVSMKPYLLGKTKIFAYVQCEPDLT